MYFLFRLIFRFSFFLNLISRLRRSRLFGYAMIDTNR